MITKIISFMPLLTIVIFFCFRLCNQQELLACTLFSQDGIAGKALCELLVKSGIEHDNSLATIVSKTQEKWLRPADRERFELEDTGDHKREELWPLLVNVGLVNECYPSKKSYEYCLVLGATVSTTRARLAYVVRLWEEGTRFNHFVFLTGARDLDEKIESVSALCDHDQKILPIRTDWQWDQNNAPKIEADMMRLVYDQAMLPDTLRELGVMVIDTPKQITNTATPRRPNTGDTLVAWLSTNPRAGSCLVISNQPFVGYQDAVVSTIIPESFEVETVGSFDSADYESISVYLDSLARWLYQEQIRLKKK